MLTPDRVIDILGLEPLPHEGGAFRETYRSPTLIDASSVPGEHANPTRNVSTQIYYMLRKGETSALHRVLSDEVFHHYFGDPVKQIVITGHDDTGGRLGADLHLIGSDLEAGERPQVVVPAQTWQGAILAETPTHAHAYGFALLGCTVAPGFDWEDFELIDDAGAAGLASALPEHAPLIRALTPVPGRTRA